MVNCASTFFRAPERSEIVILKFPTDGKLFIERVIGIPRDIVEVSKGTPCYMGRFKKITI